MSKENKSWKDDSFLSPGQEEIRKAQKKHGEMAAQKESDSQLKKFVDILEDDKKGKEFVFDEEREKEERSSKQRELVLDDLDFLRKSYTDYRNNIAEWGLYQMMEFMEIPSGFEYHCVGTSEGVKTLYGKQVQLKNGVLMVLKSPQGSVYMKAMYCRYDPVIDIGALSGMLLAMENTIDSITGRLEENDSETKTAESK